MDISVIILTYKKHHPFLLPALNSIDYNPQRSEIIVINNSPDTKINPYHETAQIINLDVEMEVGAARNYGASLAKGETLLFLDGDDWLIPNALKIMFYVYQNIKKEQNELHIIYGGLIRGDYNHVFHPQNPYFGDELNKSPLIKANRPYCCLIPRPAFDAVKGFDENLQSWEDLDFEIKTWLGGIPSTRVDSVIYYYRWDNQGRRALMDNDEQIAHTVKENLYNKYKNYYDSGVVAFGVDKNMACQTCGQKKPPVPSLSGLNTRSIPEPSPDEILYIDFVAPNEISRTLRGAYTGISYRFSKTRPRKKIVTKSGGEINPFDEIHREDAIGFMQIRLQGYDLFRVVREIIVTQPKPEPVAMAMVASEDEDWDTIVTKKEQPQPKKVATDEIDPELLKAFSMEASKQPHITTFTIKGLEDQLSTLRPSKKDIEIWEMQEQAEDNPRTGMLKLLSSLQS